MYGLRIEFEERREAFSRYAMNRQEYNNEMRRWQKDYELSIDEVLEDPGVHGNRLIFVRAKKRDKTPEKNLEVVKSRARYYSRVDSRACEDSGKRSEDEK